MSELGALLTGRPSALIALAIAFVGSLRFLRWLLPFIFERFDVAKGDLGLRLKHVELELEATRKALFLLLNRMAAKYPADPVLVEVGELLSRAWPVGRRPEPDQDLVDRLDGGSNAAAA